MAPADSEVIVFEEKVSDWYPLAEQKIKQWYAETIGKDL